VSDYRREATDVTTQRGLSESARAVLAALLETTLATRPELSVATDLSKPTVSVAIAELESAHLVSVAHRRQGATGRSAIVYGLGERSGWVLGLDLGAAHLEATAWSLDDRELDHQRIEIPSGNRSRTSDLLALAAETTRTMKRRVTRRRGPLVAAAVALPTVVSQSFDGDLPAVLTSAEALRPAAISEALGLLPTVPVLFENNVNCAAIAEHKRGAARGRDSFAYVQIGLGIGLGAVIHGKLLRGAHGAAGEISFLPFPWAPGTFPATDALESYLGSNGLLRRCREAWPSDAGPPPTSAEELFLKAAAGSRAADGLVQQHAEDAGRLVAAVAAVLDPGLVVLGGGVGKNPQLLPGIRKTVQRLNGYTEVAASELGDTATVAGAAVIANEHALDQILGAQRHGTLS
jgi:predicted NBD/HSP70 family sugar kinase/predicted transcriptional regulator